MSQTTNPLYTGQKATIANIDIWLLALQVRVDKMEREILAKDSIIADLNEKVSKLEKEKATKPVDWSKIFSAGSKNTSEETLLLAKVAKETKEKNSKENNVIISGIQESPESLSTAERKEHDQTEITKILNAIKVEPSKMKNLYRLKNRNNNQKAALIVIELATKDDQIQVLKQANELKGKEEYKNVYINRDLTKAEAELEKELRSLRNKKNAELTNGEGRLKYGKIGETEYFWGIRWGTLKKIDKSTNKPIQNQN